MASSHASGGGGLARTLARAGTVSEVRDALRRPLTTMFGSSAVFVASADPESWVITGASSEQIPSAATPLFLDNEYGVEDVVKFQQLADSAQPVQTLHRATGGDLRRSARWREILEPLGWGDEMRAALRVDGVTWGFVCLHRDRGEAPFSDHDADRLRSVAPVVAAELRRTVGAERDTSPRVDDGPGVLLLDGRGTIISASGSTEEWLGELRRPTDPDDGVVLAALARAALRNPTSVEMRAPDGRWLTLHGSRMQGPGSVRVCVVIAPTSASAAMPRLAALAGLTARERQIAAAVMRGMSTRAIAESCHISEHTVREHLKSVFAKSGVHSRRELVGRAMRGQ